MATPTSGPLSLSAIQRLNSSVGYIAGWDALGLAKTRDGGASWQRIPVPASHLSALRFIDERVGWVAGFADQGVVLRTQDGGTTWQTVLRIPAGAGGTEPVEQIQAIDGSRAWALTLTAGACAPTPCPSDLRRTTDGGQTWTTLAHGQIALMPFASATRGWIALDGPSGRETEVRMTSDGGTSWRSVLRTSSGGPFGLDAASVNTAWLLTRDGAYCTSSTCSRYQLFRTDNGGLTWAGLGNPKDAPGNCGAGHLAGPLFASAARGWLGGNAGAGGANTGPPGFFSTQNGGQTWRCTAEPQNAYLISAADPLHVWVSGQDRATTAATLYDTEDGGATWHHLTLTSLP